MNTFLSKCKGPLFALFLVFGVGTAMALDACTPCVYTPGVTQVATPMVSTVTYREPVTVTETVTRTVPVVETVTVPERVTTTYTTVQNTNYLVPTTNGWIETAYRPVGVGGPVQYFPVTRYETIRVVDVARP